MGGNTVSNGSKIVVNQNSGHVFMTLGSTDVCKAPIVPVGFPNCAPAKNLAAGKTTQTFITGAPICVLRTIVTPSTGDEGGVGGGVVSGTFKAEAKATAGSTDLFIEGDPAIRSFDPTTQNHANTTGMVIFGVWTGNAQSMMDKLKKKCTLVKFEGNAGSRKLGWPDLHKTGHPYYLDIFESDTVVFHTVRHDITMKPPAVNPKCFMSKPHTSWLAKGRVFPLYAYSEEKTEEGVEQFDIEGEMVVSALTLNLIEHLQAPDPHQAAFIEKQREGAHHAHSESHAHFEGNILQIMAYLWWWVNPPTIQVTASACSSPRSATIKVFPKKPLKFEWSLERDGGKKSLASKNAHDSLEKAKDAVNKAQDAAGQAQTAADQAQANAAAAQGSLANATAARQAAEAEKDSLKDNARAQRRNAARAKKRQDARNTEAEESAKYEEAQRQFNQVVDALHKAKEICDTTQKIARLAGSGQELTVEFAHRFKIGVKCAFKPTSDHQSLLRQYTDATIGQELELELKSDPLVGVRWRGFFSLLDLVFGFPPGAGPAGWFRKLVRLDVVCSAMIGLVVGVTIKKSEIDELSGESTAGVDFRLSMGLVAGAAGVDIAEMTAALPGGGEFRFSHGGAEHPDVHLQVTPSFECRATFEVVLFPDSWFFRYEVASWSPEALHKKIEGEPWVLWASPR